VVDFGVVPAFTANDVILPLLLLRNDGADPRSPSPRRRRHTRDRRHRDDNGTLEEEDTKPTSVSDDRRTISRDPPPPLTKAAGKEGKEIIIVLTNKCGKFKKISLIKKGLIFVQKKYSAHLLKRSFDFVFFRSDGSISARFSFQSDSMG
jgi:hypothetical protein